MFELSERGSASRRRNTRTRAGAHTGEVSGPMLKSVGCAAVIVGHSERRAMGETDQAVNEKVRAALAHNLVPILCLGMWPRVLYVSVEPTLTAFGKPQWRMVSSLVKLIYVAVGIPLAFYHYGMLGVVVVVALNDLPHWVIISIGLAKERVSVFMQDLRSTAVLLAVIAAVFGLRHWLSF